MKKITFRGLAKLGTYMALFLTLTHPGSVYGQPRQDQAPELRPPVNAGGTRRTTPTIVLPEGWTNPGTGRSGGAVPEPVPVAPSTGTVQGQSVSPSTGTTGGYSVGPSTGTTRSQSGQSSPSSRPKSSTSSSTQKKR